MKVSYPKNNTQVITQNRQKAQLVIPVIIYFSIVSSF